MDDKSDNDNGRPKGGDIVRRIISGDKSAEAELVKAFDLWLLVILRRKFPSKSFIEDVVQDTFIVALAAIPKGKIKDPDRIGAFLRSTAYNIGYEYLRKENKHRSAADPDTLARIPDPSTDLFSRIDSQARVERVRRLIDKLSVPRDREVLVRFYYLNQDKQTVCRDLDLSSAHFDRVLYRAKQRLKKLFDDQDGSPDCTTENGPEPDNGGGSDSGAAGVPFARSIAWISALLLRPQATLAWRGVAS